MSYRHDAQKQTTVVIHSKYISYQLLLSSFPSEFYKESLGDEEINGRSMSTSVRIQQYLRGERMN